MKEEKTIQQLLEMLDHPEAYTEQEIRDIINQDEETREVYRMMVEAKRSSRHTHANNLSNVDAAWERFNQKRNTRRSHIHRRSFPLRTVLCSLSSHFVKEECRGNGRQPGSC